MYHIKLSLPFNCNKTLIVIVFFLLCGHYTFAQQTRPITGHIADEVWKSVDKQVNSDNYNAAVSGLRDGDKIKPSMVDTLSLISNVIIQKTLP